jgi:hypothetical protein
MKTANKFDLPNINQDAIVDDFGFPIKKPSYEKAIEIVNTHPDRNDIIDKVIKHFKKVHSSVITRHIVISHLAGKSKVVSEEFKKCIIELSSEWI